MSERRTAMRIWTKQSALDYIENAKEKGLTYWSAIDYLRNHCNEKV